MRITAALESPSYLTYLTNRKGGAGLHGQGKPITLSIIDLYAAAGFFFGGTAPTCLALFVPGISGHVDARP